MLGQRPGSRPTTTSGDLPVTQAIFVYLADVDAHFERARAAGARIDKAPEDLPYGRSYGARDLEGHVWYFTTPPSGVERGREQGAALQDPLSRSCGRGLG